MARLSPMSGSNSSWLSGGCTAAETAPNAVSRCTYRSRRPWAAAVGVELDTLGAA
jgi:hypothetical protein